MDEFLRAMKEHSTALSRKNLFDLFSYFDRDRAGSIQIEEFIVGIRGELNSRRKEIVNMVRL